jgi:predicted aspartyl protease
VAAGKLHRFDVASNETVPPHRKDGATVDDMGLFRTTIEVQNWELRGPIRSLPNVLVDTGSEYTWISRDVLQDLRVVVQRKQGFIVADGRRIDRDVGYALVRAGGSEAPDMVVFAEPGDLVLLGAHALEGMNLKIDPVRKELVPAGPVIAAAAA